MMMTQALTIFLVFVLAMTCHGFLYPSTTSSFSTRVDTTDSSRLQLQQKRGESNMDFIKRMTAEGVTSKTSNEEEDEEKKATKKKGGYKRIEEWDAERKESGELSWEERVMYDGQRHGNQVRQNDILNRHLGLY